MKTRRPICRACGRRRANRPLDLCWSCYYTPGLRGIYKRSHQGDPGYGVNPSCGKVQPAPTRALSGTRAKVYVLRERCRRGEALFTKKDAERL